MLVRKIPMILKGIIFPLGLFLLSGCILTNQLGIRPPGDVYGKDVKTMVGETSLIGFALSLDTYCNQFENSSICARALNSDAREKGLALVYYLTPELLSIDEGDLFSAESVDACVNEAYSQMLSVPFLYFQNQESTGGTGSFQLEHPQRTVKEAAAGAAYGSAAACRGVLAEPGPIF